MRMEGGLLITCRKISMKLLARFYTGGMGGIFAEGKGLSRIDVKV